MADFAAGQRATAAVLNRRGIIKYGRRDSNSSTSASTTDVGVLRIDGISVISGRAYVIHVTCHPTTSGAATDVARCNVRGSTSGNATTSSGIIPSGQFFQPMGSPQSFDFLYIASSTATLSLLLCIARFSGSGNVSLYGDGTRNTEIWVEDASVITDTGTDI